MKLVCTRTLGVRSALASTSGGNEATLAELWEGKVREGRDMGKLRLELKKPWGKMGWKSGGPTERSELSVHRDPRMVGVGQLLPPRKPSKAV